MGTNSSLIERYSFVSLEAYELVKVQFPHAVSYGASKVLQYASPSQSAEMLALVDASGLELIHHSQTNAQMIIDAIEAGIDKIYNCNHDVAEVVCRHFSLEKFYEVVE